MVHPSSGGQPPAVEAPTSPVELTMRRIGSDVITLPGVDARAQAPALELRPIQPRFRSRHT